MKIWHKVVISTVVGVLAYRLMTNVDEDILGWIAGVLIGLVVYLAIGLAGRTFIWSEPLVPHVSSSRKAVALVLWCREVIRPLRTRAVQVLRVLAAIYVGLAAQTLVSNAFFHSQYVQILAAASSLGLAAGLMYWMPTATEPQPPAGGQHVDTC